MEIELNHISKKFGNIDLFKDFSLHIKQGEFIAILGQSGKGKSTLLNIIALFEEIDSGEIIVNGEKDTLNKKFKKLYWRYNIGYIFQNYGLINNVTVEKNLDIALEYADKNKEEKNILKRKALEEVGLKDQERKMVYTLSGGEQQRLAIARLLVKPCDIVLADEPTGALDDITKSSILQLFNLFKVQGKTVIIVTHDKQVASICDRVVDL